MKIIDLTANLAKKTFKSKNFTFHELLELVQSKNPSLEIDVADLYVNIIEDVRFLSIGAQKWRLHENLKYEEVEKIRMAMFGNKQYYDSNIEEEQEEVVSNENDIKSDMNDNLNYDKIDDEIEIIDIDFKDSIIDEDDEDKEDKEKKE